jgi:AraC-like DNA-binding protein
VFYELFPDASANLVLRLSPQGARLVLLGPKTEKAGTEIHEAADYYVIRFRPGQTLRLTPDLGVARPEELVNACLELPSLCGRSLDEVAERLLTLPDHAARGRMLDGLLRAARPIVRDEGCRQAAAFIDAANGVCRVRDVADALGLHPRSLERRFNEHLGLAPKTLCRLVRLQRLLLRVRSGGFKSLADLAFEHGYADQAHMIHDVKELTGLSPARTSAGRPLPEDALQTRIVHRYRP